MRYSRTIKRWTHKIPVLCSSASAGIAVFALIVWIFGSWKFLTFGFNHVPMAPSTAILLIVINSIFVVEIYKVPFRARRMVTLSALLFVAIVSVLVLMESRFGFIFHIEGFLSGGGETLQGIPVGRMAPITAITFILIAGSLFWRFNSTSGKRVFQGTALLSVLIVLVIASIILCGYMLGAPFLYGGLTIPMSFLAAISFLLLGLGLVWNIGRGLFISEVSDQKGAFRTPFPWLPTGMILCFAAMIVVTGFLYFRNEAANARRTAQDQLSAIARLKVDQIVNWRNERLGDAGSLTDSPFLSRALAEWTETNNSALKEELLLFFQALSKHYQYSDILFVGMDNRIRLSLQDRSPSVPSLIKDAATVAFKKQKPVMMDLHTVPDRYEPHFDLLAPIFRRDNERIAPLGLVVLRCSARQLFYPIVEYWPTTSSTAETLLVEKSGEDVLFLNDLRHRKGSALKYRLPLRKTNLPAALGVQGYRGVAEGIDYRGVPVVAAMKAVPDTPWVMVAKIDQQEIYAPLRERGWSTGIVVLVMTFFLALVVGFLWWRRDRRWIVRQMIADRKEKELAREIEYFLKSAQDIIIFADDEGHIFDANRRALEAYGYSLDELKSMNLSELSPPGAHGETMLHLLDPNKENHPVFETVQLRKDGSTFPVEISVGLVEIAGVVKIMEIVRDITERKLAENEREIATEFLRIVNESTTKKAMIHAALTFFKERVGCEAVGIRLQDGEDYPYFETRGFPPEFVLLENSLCARDEKGQVIRDLTNLPIIECMCGNVIRGRFDPSKSFFTADGSFWSNGTSELLATTSDKDRLTRTRNRCNGAGYESVALMPLRSREECMGLLQLNDHRRGVFSKETIYLWERLAGYLTIALLRFRDEEEIRQLNQTLEQRVIDRTVKLENTNKELEAFSYSVSHDLRSPLRGIDGFSKVLLEDYADQLDETARGYLFRVRKAAQRMGFLIDDLLRLSRITKKEIALEPIDLSRIAADIIETLRRNEPERSVETVIRDKINAIADPYFIHIAMENLLNNAWKFTGKNQKAKIEFGVFRQDGENIYYVSDNGVGFDMAYMDKLFRPFQRLHREDEFPGTGVGLATVHRIINRLGGRIWVEAKPNDGVTFYFTI